MKEILNRFNITLVENKANIRHMQDNRRLGWLTVGRKHYDVDRMFGLALNRYPISPRREALQMNYALFIRFARPDCLSNFVMR
jgi:hypothetical protein